MADPFAQRLAKVRHRFVSALEGKIEDSYAAIPQLAHAAPEAPNAVAETYRRMHGLVGIGPAVGFAATSRAARGVENILLPPHKSNRGLTPEEIDSFKRALHTLRDAAATELQSFYSGWR